MKASRWAPALANWFQQGDSLSSNIENTTYTTTDHIVHSEWVPHVEMPWVVVKQIACTACGIFAEVSKTDTWHGNAKAAANAEKAVYQWLKDRGCPHVMTSAGAKHMDPSDITGGKGHKSGGRKAAAKK